MADIALAFAGACKPKEWEQSVHILRTLMPAADIEPDAQSFEHVAAACEEGHESGQQVSGLYHQSYAFTFSCLIWMQLVCSSEHPILPLTLAAQSLAKSCRLSPV